MRRFVLGENLKTFDHDQEHHSSQLYPDQECGGLVSKYLRHNEQQT